MKKMLFFVFLVLVLLSPQQLLGNSSAVSDNDIIRARTRNILQTQGTPGTSLDFFENDMDFLERRRLADSLRLVDSLIAAQAIDTASAIYEMQTMTADAAQLRFDEFNVELNVSERLSNEMIAMGLRPFGSEFFRVTSEAMMNIGPVNSEYRLGVGDEVIIQIWGDVQITESLVIGRNGAINPTGIGQQRIAGLTVAEARRMLTQRFSRVYSGIRNGAPNATTFIEVTPGTLRRKNVIVVGEVQRPGTYLIPSTAGIVTAIAEAGGPTDNASLRNIIIRRGGAENAHTVDLYDYFLSGKITDTVSLADFDVILVSSIDRYVNISGAIRRPARYELKPEDTFADLIRFAGGILPEAHTKNISIERTTPGVGRKNYTVNEEDMDKIIPQRNDFVHIDFIDRLNNTVSIEGAVKRPGQWGFKEGMTILDLIELADGVLEEFFGDRAEIMRMNEDLTKEILSFNLADVFSGHALNMELQKWDVLKIYSIWDLQYREYIDIFGEVNTPGRYFLRQGMTIEDILLLAGGFTRDAYKDTVEISRIVSSDVHRGNRLNQIQIEVGYDFFKTSTNLLRDRDVIFVRRNSKKQDQEIIHLSGEFVFPGYYAKSKRNETLSSLIKRAGGFRESAYLEGAIFQRAKDDVGQVAVNFDALFSKNKSIEDIILEDGDRIFVPTDPKTVSLLGGIHRPTNVKFVRGRSVRHYLNQAGGRTADGKRGDIYVIRANGEVRAVKRSNRNAVNAGSEIIVTERAPRERNPQVALTSMATMASMTATILSIVIILDSR